MRKTDFSSKAPIIRQSIGPQVTANNVNEIAMGIKSE